MKKALIVAVLLTMASPTYAWNLNFWGSNDHQHKHRNRSVTTPDNPVSVPEPGTLLLVGLGLAGVAVLRKKS